MYKLVFAPHNCGPALIFGHFRSPFPSIKYPSEAQKEGLRHNRKS